MFEIIKNAFLQTLGIKSFDKDSSGNITLSKEQEQKLIEAHGEKAVEQFKKDLKEVAKAGNDNEIVQRINARLEDMEKSYKASLEAIQDENKSLKAKVEKLEQEPETEPALIIEKGANDKPVPKLSAKIKNYQHNTLVLKKDLNYIAAGNTINVDDVVSEFGDLLDYYKPETLTGITTGFETAKLMTTKRAIKSWKASKAIISSVVQQFVPKWTPAGSTTFTALEIPLRRMKINLPITPADVEDWIFQMYDESKDLDQQPITKYILNTLLKPRALEDIELKMIASGEYEALDWSTVNEGDPGQVPEKSMDGFMTILREQKALGSASNINFVDLGTINDNNIVDKMNEFVDSIDSVYRAKNMPIICSQSRYLQYKRAYKKLYGTQSGDTNFGSDVIDYSLNRLIWTPSMHAEEGFFATPKENFILLRHINEPGASRIFMQKNRYSLEVFGEFRLGTGFAMAEAVFAYIPDSGSGSGSGS